MSPLGIISETSDADFLPQTHQWGEQIGNSLDLSVRR